jgi:hypothetical protein
MQKVTIRQKGERRPVQKTAALSGPTVCELNLQQATNGTTPAYYVPTVVFTKYQDPGADVSRTMNERKYLTNY